MGKAKTYGGIAVVVGLILLLLAMLLVSGTDISAFIAFLINVWLPILLVTVGIVIIIIGLLLLVYG